MENLIDLYISHLEYLHRTERKPFSPLTFTQYREKLTLFERFLSEEYQLSLTMEHVHLVTADIVNAYYDRLIDLKRARNTRNNYISILKCFFDFLMKKKIITVDPGEELYPTIERYSDAKPPARDTRYFTRDEIQRYLDTMDTKVKFPDVRDVAMTTLMLSAGLRVSETCSMNICDGKTILREGYAALLRKGGEWARLEFAKFAIQRLRMYMQMRGIGPDDAPLFISSWGNRMERKHTWARFAKLQAEAGLKSGTHKWRHSGINEVRETQGPTAAYLFAGHRDMRTTEKDYSHHDIEGAKKRAELLPYR